MASAHFLILCLSALSLSMLPFNDCLRLALPITKDPSTNQYLAEIHQRTPLVPVKASLDLGGPFLWVDCANYKSSTWKPVRCRSAQCNLARSKTCVTQCFSTPRPGCTNKTCGLNVDNRWTKTSTGGSLGYDTVKIQTINGQSGGRNVSAPKILFGCGESPALPGLANGATGVAGFGRTKVSFPSVLSSAFSFPNKFAICLSGTQGVIFFGGGPYKFGLPERPVYMSDGVPLISNPVSTAGAFFKGDRSTDYFIGVKGISFLDKPIRLNTSLLRIDGAGNGGTMLSTVVPYTVMESSIYSAVMKAAFTRYMPPRLPAVAPFTHCYNSTRIGSNRLGYAVPPIVLKLSNGEEWPFYGMHSLKNVAEDVACVAFVDGGKNPRASIVIGSFQMEDCLLEFDLAQSKLRRYIALPFIQTTCAGSNFTAHF